MSDNLPRDMTEAEFEYFIAESRAGRGRDAVVDARDKDIKLSPSQAAQFTRQILADD